MIPRNIAVAISAALVDALGVQYANSSFAACGAGCINDTVKASAPGAEPVFIKLGPATALPMYEQEAKGLKLLSQCQAFRIPHVYFCTNVQNKAMLAMEFIAMEQVRPGQGEAFGQALAELHLIEQPRYGLDHNNYIGRSPQINRWTENWWDFYVECRLQPQLRLAVAKGMRAQLSSRLQQLMPLIPQAFTHHRPKASLVHGDLWSGNMAVDEQGKPTLFDPAVYFGDAETDLAMSRMFGALPANVYKAYHRALPLQQGHQLRQQVYDLYHWLNHFNLFGVTYLGQVEHTVNSLLLLMEKQV